MLLYLSTPGNEALFSEHLEKQGIFMDYIDITRYPTLMAALGRNRALPNYEYIMFHFNEPPETEPVQEAVAHIRRFHHARVIVFSPQCAETTGLFSILTEMGLRELVAVNAETDLLSELQECMSQEGKGYLNSVKIAASAGIETAKANMRPTLSILQDTLITLGIAGTQSRVGATTQAFCTYHALKALGLAPCIIDKKRAFAEMLASVYPEEFIVDGSLFSVRGIVFANDIQIGTAYNAFIIDLGVLAGDTAQDFGNCDIRLLCSGGKDWEFPHLAKILNDYPDLAQRVVFSFVSPNDEKGVVSLMSGIIPSSFAPWSPDIWNAGGDWHERLLIRICHSAFHTK